MTRSQKEIIETTMAFVNGNQITGDYLEFGLYQGKTFFQAVKAANYFKLRSMRFWGFDSFEGLPEPCDEQTATNGYTEGRFACSVHDFEQRMRHAGMDRPRVELVAGWYKDSLTVEVQQRVPKAAVVWVDCDLYHSAKLVLEFVTPLVQEGTVLIFDDWFAFRGNPREGEQRACGEWLKGHLEITLTDYQVVNWNGKAFLVHLE